MPDVQLHVAFEKRTEKAFGGVNLTYSNSVDLQHYNVLSDMSSHNYLFSPKALSFSVRSPYYIGGFYLYKPMYLNYHT